MLRAAAARLREVGGDSAHAEEILSRADAIEQIADRDAWRAIERKALRFQAHRAGRGRDRK